MLEVLTRRYYGNQGAARRAYRRGGRLHVRGRRAADSSVVRRRGEPSSALGEALPRLAELAAAEDAVDADIYLGLGGPAADPDAMAAALHTVVRALALPQPVSRSPLTVAGRRGAVMHHHFTSARRPTGSASSG